MFSDDSVIEYKAPHWLDNNDDGDSDDAGDRHYPVAYTRNAMPTLAATFSSSEDIGGFLVEVKATGPGAIAIPPTTVTGSTSANLTGTLSSGLFLNKVKFYCAQTAGQEFTLNWSFRVDGGGWSSAGTTKHTLYLTYADPDSSMPESKVNQESLFNIGCRMANDEDDPNIIFSGIWDEFSDRKVSRVLESTGLHTRDANGMIYWRPGSNGCVLVDQLLEDGDASCGTWAWFMQACLNAQGISGHELSTVIAPGISNYISAVADFKVKFS